MVSPFAQLGLPSGFALRGFPFGDSVFAISGPFACLRLFPFPDRQGEVFSSIFSLFFVVSMKPSFGFSSLRPDIINVFSCTFLFSASCWACFKFKIFICSAWVWICCLWSSTTDWSCDSSLKAFRVGLLQGWVCWALGWPLLVRGGRMMQKRSTPIDCVLSTVGTPEFGPLSAIIVYFRFSLRGEDWCFASVLSSDTT